MNKIYTFMLGLLLSFAAVAQQEVVNLPLSDLPIPISKVEDIAFASDKEGNTCLYLSSTNARSRMNMVQMVSLLPAGEVLAKTLLPEELPMNESLLGILTTPKFFNYFRYNRSADNHELTHLEVEKSTGISASRATITLEVDSKAKYVASFVAENELLMLFYLKKPSTIQIVRLDARGLQHTSDLSVDIPYATERLTKGDNFVYMDNKSAKTVFAGHHKKKVYKQGEKLYLVFDDFAAVQSKMTTTEILELDLKAGTHRLSSLPSIPKSVTSSFATYLHQNHLFWLSISGKELQLAVYDLASLQRLALHHFSKNDELTLKSTPVYKRGAISSYEPAYDILEETSKVLRKMGKGKAALVVEGMGENTLQLTIGAYQELQSGGGSMMTPIGGGTIATPRGNIGMPVSWMNISGSSYGHGSGVSTYFRSFMHAGTFEKAEHSNLMSLQDQIDHFEEILRRRNTQMGAKAIFMHEDAAYLTYVDQKEKSLKCFKFTKDTIE